MKKRKWFFRVAGLLFCLNVFAACNVIFGAPETGDELPAQSGSSFPLDRYVEGTPGADMKIQGGLFLWRTGNAWSVRVAKKLQPVKNPFGPVWAGTIRIENGIVISGKRQLNPTSDVQLRGNTLVYKFELRDNVEGFDFRVKPTASEYCLALEASFDGVQDPGLVHLGSFMRIPESLPLRICLRSFE